MYWLLILLGILIFLIGYYCGKQSSVSNKIKPVNNNEIRFSKLNNKVPAFIRKINEKEDVTELKKN